MATRKSVQSTTDEAGAGPEAVTKLKLRTKSIEKLQSRIRQCVDLISLDISGSELTALPPSISERKKLKHLNISRNLFEKIPMEVFDIPMLEGLFIGRNRLKDIPEDINKLTQLKTLEIFMNEFNECPRHVCSLSQLENLDCGRNNFDSLPDSFGELTSLRTLKIYGNKFDRFPRQICDFAFLKELDVSDNNLTYIPEEIRNMISLKSLDISMNDLEEFPIHICSLAKLVDLNLNRNKISKVPPNISKLTELRSLSVSNNKLEEFPIEVCDIPNLESLYMEFNKIQFVPDKIAKLQRLRKLCLDHNRISHLPHQLEHLKCLRELYVKNDQLIQPPKSICKNGRDAIYRFLRGLRETKAVGSKRLQLNLLGESTSGKSSLSRTLQKGEPTLTAEVDRTHVIEQASWYPNDEVSFNINDFGGHDVYKVGYPIFINENGVSLVLFNLSQYQRTEEYYKKHVGDWVHTVQSRTPGIRVTVVGTHLDKVETQSVKEVCDDVRERLRHDMAAKDMWLEKQISSLVMKLRQPENDNLREIYEENIERLQSKKAVIGGVHKEIYRISSANMTGYPALMSHLMSLARKRGVVLPGAWLKVMHKMDQMKYVYTVNTVKLTEVEEFVLNATKECQNSAEDSNKSATMCEATDQPEDVDEEVPDSGALFAEDVDHMPNEEEITESPEGKSLSSEEVSQVVDDILRYMSKSGDIVWFENNPQLRQVVFHKPELLANLLKSVLNHNADKVKEILCQRFSKKNSQAILEDFLKRGMLSKDVMSRCLWEPFKLSTMEEDAILNILQALELCYKIKVDGGGDTFFVFPWMLTVSQPEGVASRRKWPKRFKQDSTQLTLKTHLPYKCPDGLFEKLSVSLHSHISLFTKKREDWKDGVYAEYKTIQIQLLREIDKGDWVITAAVRGKQLPELWEMLLKIKQDEIRILQQDWPGVSYDMHLVCPHCVREGFPNPTTFPATLIDNPTKQSMGVDFLPCDNAPNGVVPASFVYPVWSGPGIMSREHKDLIQRNMRVFADNITEPGVGDIVNKLLEEGILLDGDAEHVYAFNMQEGKVEILLNTICSKDDRTFFIFRDYLKETGQNHLALLLIQKIDQVHDEEPSSP